MNRKKIIDKAFNIIIEGKEELITENPLLGALLRAGLAKYLFSDSSINAVKKMVGLGEPPTQSLKKIGLDVKADDTDVEEYLKDDELSKSEREELGLEDDDFSEFVSEEDFKFYTKILRGLDVPLSKSNYFFLYGIAQTEYTKARFNPFATTMKMPNSELFGSNSAGVQSYSTENEGVKATVDTMKLKYYKGIVDAMRENDGSDFDNELENVAEMWVVSPWGTKTLMPTIHGYIEGNDPKPKPITR